MKFPRFQLVHLQHTFRHQHAQTTYREFNLDDHPKMLKLFPNFQGEF
jgi:hypothetical protein